MFSASRGPDIEEGEPERGSWLMLIVGVFFWAVIISVFVGCGKNDLAKHSRNAILHEKQKVKDLEAQILEMDNQSLSLRDSELRLREETKELRRQNELLELDNQILRTRLEIEAEWTD